MASTTRPRSQAPLPDGRTYLTTGGATTTFSTAFDIVPGQEQRLPDAERNGHGSDPRSTNCRVARRLWAGDGHQAGREAERRAPAAVGSNSFWKQSTSWITGQSTKDTVGNIEASWPK